MSREINRGDFLMEEKKNGGDAGVDIFKFYMSILVVLRNVIQSWCAPDSFWFLVVTNGLSTVAVPFFLLLQGICFLKEKMIVHI